MSKRFLFKKCEEKSSLFVKYYSMFIVCDRESVDCRRDRALPVCVTGSHLGWVSKLLQGRMTVWKEVISYFSRFLPNGPAPWVVLTLIQWLLATQSARSRRFYGKMVVCEQSRESAKFIRDQAFFFRGQREVSTKYAPFTLVCPREPLVQGL